MAYFIFLLLDQCCQIIWFLRYRLKGLADERAPPFTRTQWMWENAWSVDLSPKQLNFFLEQLDTTCAGKGLWNTEWPSRSEVWWVHSKVISLPYTWLWEQRFNGKDDLIPLQGTGLIRSWNIFRSQNWTKNQVFPSCPPPPPCNILSGHMWQHVLNRTFKLNVG